ncbi:three-Cys-motif partner protein TcmP [uncultured Cohaesibacter sp.]|uniref:three-Cys-motif partner protein TcmP n=1 Tax=uncultured Cohaesibacter sp. TaxID=1002546 RepID=UPI0029C818EA|nr:three-Cys-motif partner protein TcmP [uncultured Cohaesibacter sp.]
MVHVPYKWVDGAVLGEHSKKKHQVLRRYISEYLNIRCSMPQQSRFRFAIIDGFAGAGAYQGGEPGSPLIFLELLLEQTQEINVRRTASGMAEIQFECLFIFNDLNRDAIEILKQNVSPFQNRCNQRHDLSAKISFMNEEFETAYPNIKKHLAALKLTRNVFFNLDQCGNSWVSRSTIVDILTTYQSSEVLLNFAAQSMFTYLSRNNPVALKKTLKQHGVDEQQVEEISRVASKREWRAAIEKLVFESYRRCGPYVSPFAINNPDGWLYWLLHFANEPKARQVYNDLLHENSGVQGHYGRSGLNMLTYDPSNEGQDYLFTDTDRQRAYEELFYDIPRVVSEFGDAVSIGDFIRGVSNETPSHSMDMAQAMIDNPDLSVRTENGGERRSASGIRSTDTLILKPQRSFLLMPPLKQ